MNSSSGLQFLNTLQSNKKTIQKTQETAFYSSFALALVNSANGGIFFQVELAILLQITNFSFHPK